MRPVVDRDLLHEYAVAHRGTVYVLAEGLLAVAHQAGVRQIAVDLVQAPTAGNGWEAVCAATVVTPAGRFRGLGDASPRTSRDTEASALLLLAQARAKARTLCDALNLAVTPIEDAPGYGPP